MGRRPPEPPSAAELIAAMQEINKESGLAKYVPLVVIAMIVGLLGWVGTSLAGLPSSIATMSANLASVQKSVDEIKMQQGGLTDKVSDLQSRLAQHDLRLNAMDQWRATTNDRLRLVEGQHPLQPVASRSPQ